MPEFTTAFAPAQARSCVAIGKIGTDASASGAASDASTPVSPRSSGPKTSKMRQPLTTVASALQPPSTRSSRHTSERSSPTSVNDQKPAPRSGVGGVSASAPSRQTA